MRAAEGATGALSTDRLEAQTAAEAELTLPHGL